MAHESAVNLFWSFHPEPESLLADNDYNHQGYTVGPTQNARSNDGRLQPFLVHFLLVLVSSHYVSSLT